MKSYTVAFVLALLVNACSNARLTSRHDAAPSSTVKVTDTSSEVACKEGFTGRVSDELGKPVIKCIIEIKQLNGQVLESVETNKDGCFVLKKIPSQGEFKMEITPLNCYKGIRIYDQDSYAKYPPVDIQVQCGNIEGLKVLGKGT